MPGQGGYLKPPRPGFYPFGVALRPASLGPAGSCRGTLDALSAYAIGVSS